MIAIIYARNNQYIIGKNNKLCWHYKEDLKFFKEKTTNQVVIMGRKTFESIGKELPNRINIIVTSQKYDLITASSLHDALEKARIYNKDIYIIGGASLYAQAMSEQLVDVIYETIVPDFVEEDGDVVFIDKIPNSYKLINHFKINNLQFNEFSI